MPSYSQLSSTDHKPGESCEQSCEILTFLQKFLAVDIRTPHNPVHKTVQQTSPLTINSTVNCTHHWLTVLQTDNQRLAPKKSLKVKVNWVTN